MYDDISYVFMNKDSPWTLSMMCISKYVTCLWEMHYMMNVLKGP